MNAITPTARHSERQKELAETQHLRTYGYAPGDYISRCRQPGCRSHDGLSKTADGPLLGTFIGDKRAWTCKECAQRLFDEECAKKDTGPVRMPQLVRDKMVPRNGIDEGNERVSDALAVALLVGKLHAEVAELSLDLKNPQEYADVLDIVAALAMKHGVTMEMVRQASAEKHAVKGGFDTNNFWIPEHYHGASHD